MPELDANRNPENLDEEEMLAKLLEGRVLFASALGGTVQLYVLCNDVFAWACADLEDLPYDKIGSLYCSWKNDATWGAIKWCCRHRNEKPQGPIERDMRADGSWDDEMEGLRPNYC